MPESTIVRLRRRWRALFAGSLSPRAVGAAAALGGGLGVAPIPGLQMAATALLAWRLRLNLPIALLVSNISFGPLLAVWAAAAASIGHWLHSGQAPWRSFAGYRADFAAAEGFAGVLAATGRCLLDWLLGSVVVVPAVAGMCWLAAFAVATAAARLRRRGELAIPHAPPLRLVQGPVRGDAARWRVEALVDAASPAAAGGQVRSAYLIEIAAQAIAAGAALGGGSGARPGRLVAVRDWTVHATVAAGTPIAAEVVPGAALGGMRSAQVRLSSAGVIVAAGTLQVAEVGEPRTPVDART